MSKWSECAHASGVWCVCARALAHAAFTRGVGITLDGGRVWSVVLTHRHSYNNQSHTSLVLHERDWVLHEAIWLADASVGAWKVEKFSTSAASSASEATRRTHNSVQQRLTSLHSKSTRGVDADADAPCEWGVSLRKRRKAPEVISRAYTSLIAQITWTWLCTRGKKRYKYCSFSHTNRSFRVLGHQCVVTMGNCLIWISLCMFFFW